MPIFALVADGDPRNAASLAQPGKEAADFIAWLMDPFARSGNWAERIERWRNARLQDRFTIDHMGYSGGRIQNWMETWRGDEAITATTVSTWLEKTAQRWVATLTDGGAGTLGQIVVASGRLARSLTMTIGVGAADLASVTAEAPCNFETDNGIVFEVDTYDLSAAITEQAVSNGLADPGSTGFGGVGLVGAVFAKGNGDANWQCVVGDGAAVTVVDSGVAYALATLYKLRIEWHGSGVADNSASAVRFYINGTLVATTTTHLPTAASPRRASPFLGIKRDTGTSSRLTTYGPVHFAANY
jgi:hypothetical protein